MKITDSFTIDRCYYLINGIIYLHSISLFNNSEMHKNALQFKEIIDQKHNFIKN